MLLAGLAVFFVMILAAAPCPSAGRQPDCRDFARRQGRCQRRGGKAPSRFTPTTAAIKGTVFIAGAQKGQKVTVELIYATQNLSVLTMNKDLPGAGKVTFAFALPKPEKGWPKGDYKMVISTSDGATKDVFFQVK